MIDKGVNVNIVDHLGNTALMHACRSNHTDVVELLLQNGADINIVDKAGCHVLLESSGRGFTDIIYLSCYITGKLIFLSKSSLVVSSVLLYRTVLEQ